MNLPRFSAAASELARIGRAFYARGWALGTSGNLSAVVAREPLRLAITASGIDKSALTPAGILSIDARGRPRLARGTRGARNGAARPSSETLVHLAIVRATKAGAVFHTHSVWSTLLSDACARDGGLALEGYEMLKGLNGIATHQHREWLPVLDNSQAWEALGGTVEAMLSRQPSAHGFLLRLHGLYTWGRDIAEAKRHAEILEFLLEVEGRRRSGR